MVQKKNQAPPIEGKKHHTDSTVQLLGYFTLLTIVKKTLKSINKDLITLKNLLCGEI